MRHSQVDKRAKRNAPRQSVSDYGGHKDAPERTTRVRLPSGPPTTWSFRPLRLELDQIKRKEQ